MVPLNEQKNRNGFHGLVLIFCLLLLCTVQPLAADITANTATVWGKGWNNQSGNTAATVEIVLDVYSGNTLSPACATAVPFGGSPCLSIIDQSFGVADIGRTITINSGAQFQLLVQEVQASSSTFGFGQAGKGSDGTVFGTSACCSQPLTGTITAITINVDKVCFSNNKGCGTVFNDGTTPDNAIMGRITFVTSGGGGSGPVLSSILPNAANAGDPALPLTVNGSGFVSGDTVLWNGTALNTVFVSATQLTATIPVNLLASQGSASVLVQDPSFNKSSALTFTINPPNTLSLLVLSPSSATAGGQPFTMTLYGTGFVSGDTVLWNATALTTTFVNPTQLTAQVTAGLTASQGTASVSVQNPALAKSNSLTFTIGGSLSITNLSPNSANAGDPQLTMTVTGAGFVSGDTVLWNGSALTTTFVTSAQLTATVPATLLATAGSASVTVRDPGGATSTALTFTINSVAGLAVSSLSPNAALAGGVAFTLTVNGSGFVNGSTVLWNSTLLPTTFVGSTQLTASVSAALIASVATVSVAVQNPGGATSNALPFTVSTQTLGLSITSLSPNSAPAGGAAFTLTVNGTGFISGAAVQWNGAALPTTFVSASQLTASVTATLIANPGTANVTVVQAGSVSNSVSFSITALSLAHFGVGGGFMMAFYAINSSSQPASFTITFYDETGHQVAIPFSGLSTTSTLTDSIVGNGAKYYEAGTFQQSPILGSAVINASAGVTIQAILRRLSSDGVYYEAAIPSGAGYNEFQIAFDATKFSGNGAQIFTGFAVANLDPSNLANVTCTARDTLGNLVPNAITVPVLNPLGHYANYLFPALNGLRGIIDCSSNTKISGIALLTLGGDSIATETVVPIR